MIHFPYVCRELIDVTLCTISDTYVNPVRQLQEMSIRTALVSNSDTRMRMF